MTQNLDILVMIIAELTIKWEEKTAHTLLNNTAPYQRRLNHPGTNSRGYHHQPTKTEKGVPGILEIKST
jgi:hypothetical protein